MASDGPPAQSPVSRLRSSGSGRAAAVEGGPDQHPVSQIGPPPGASGFSGENASWRNVLRLERQRLGLTQARVAELAGVSPETIRKYENGGRTPSRRTLIRIVEALDLSQTQRRAVLRGTGFASEDTLFAPETHPDYYFTVVELRSFVEMVPWPQFVVNNLAEIVAANQSAQGLWGIDFEDELARRSRAQLNLLSIAAERRFSQRIANWEALVGTLISVLKAVPQSAESLTGAGTLFQEVLGAFAANDPVAIPRLVSLWEKTPPRTAKVRWTYPVTWREPAVGDLRFLALVSTASEPDGLAFNDWVPLDASTWDRLSAIGGLDRPQHQRPM